MVKVSITEISPEKNIAQVKKKGIKIKKLSDIYSAGLHFQTSYMFTWISEESLIVFILFQKEKLSIMVYFRINQKLNFNIKI